MGQVFRTNHLPIKRKQEIILRAKAICDEFFEQETALVRWSGEGGSDGPPPTRDGVWWVDVLDCSKSWARQRIEMAFENILGMFSHRCHFTVIHRNLNPENHLEVGFRTGGADVDYFLWINLDPKHIPEIQAIIDRSLVPPGN